MKQLFIVTIVFVAFAAGTNFLLEFVLDLSLFEFARDAVRDPSFAAAAILGTLLVVDIFLPIPSSLVMVAGGALFGPVAGGILSLAGSLAGNLVGFELMRRFGVSVFRAFVKEDQILAMRPVVEDFGAAAIAISRPVPIVMETLTLVAGLHRMNRPTFIKASLLGTIPTVFIYAYAGATSTQLGSLVPAIAILLTVPALGWVVAQRWIFRAKRASL